MKIYINTNKEMISFNFDGDSDLGKSNFVDHVLKEAVSTLQYYCDVVEYVPHSNFMNWNGGKHDQFAESAGTLWCIHNGSEYNLQDLNDIEDIIEAVMIRVLCDANILEAKLDAIHEKRMLCGETDGREDDDQ